MGIRSKRGILLRALYWAEWPREMLKVALKLGSSKQGNAARASVGSNCVTDMNL